MRVWMAITLVAAMAASAQAQPKRKYKEGDVQGLKLVKTIEPAEGFVDDAFTFDGAGGRLLYVNSDAATMCVLKVLDIAQSFAEIKSLDLSSATTAPSVVELVLGGDSVFASFDVGTDETPRKKAVLFAGSGKVKRKFGPATDVRLSTYEGAPVVVSYDERRKRTNKGKVVVTHTVDTRSLETGKRVGNKRSLQADDTGFIKKLDLRLHYWLDDYLVAVGTQGGVWDRKEDQRSPDSAAHYDVPRKTFSKRSPIADLTQYARWNEMHADFPNERSFMRVTRDLSGLRWVHADKESKIAVAQPFYHYDPKSLRYQAGADGGMFFSVTIDTVNADAVARKKADPKWLDFYRVGPGSTEARRVGRLLIGKRGVVWRASAEHWVVMHKHIGFSRGGKTLDVYQVR